MNRYTFAAIATGTLVSMSSLAAMLIEHPVGRGLGVALTIGSGYMCLYFMLKSFIAGPEPQVHITSQSVSVQHSPESVSPQSVSVQHSPESVSPQSVPIQHSPEHVALQQFPDQNPQQKS